MFVQKTRLFARKMETQHETHPFRGQMLTWSEIENIRWDLQENGENFTEQDLEDLRQIDENSRQNITNNTRY